MARLFGFGRFSLGDEKKIVQCDSASVVVRSRNPSLPSASSQSAQIISNVQAMQSESQFQNAHLSDKVSTRSSKTKLTRYTTSLNLYCTVSCKQAVQMKQANVATATPIKARQHKNQRCIGHN